jgi:hypothetical protein
MWKFPGSVDLDMHNNFKIFTFWEKIHSNSSVSLKLVTLFPEKGPISFLGCVGNEILLLD